MKKQQSISKASKINKKRITMITSLIILFIFQAIFSKAQEKNNWNLKKDKNDIKVWIRTEPFTGLPEYKATTKIAAPIPNILAVLLDPEAYPDLFIGTTSAKLLKQEKDGQICYMQNECPFPFSDRDGVYSSTVYRDPVSGSIHISIDALPDYYPRQTNKVRVPVSKGFWKLTPLQDGRVEVIYQQYADPGGSFPLWIIKLYSVNIPFKTLNNLGSLVQLPKYQNNNSEKLLISKK